MSFAPIQTGLTRADFKPFVLGVDPPTTPALALGPVSPDPVRGRSRGGFTLARSAHVGKGPADRGFAMRAGLRYFDVADGFPAPDSVATPANSAS